MDAQRRKDVRTAVVVTVVVGVLWLPLWLIAVAGRKAEERCIADDDCLRDLFLRRVERGLGYRDPMGSGDRYRRSFTDDQVRNIRLAYHQVNKAR